MTATKRLRELLDERGILYDTAYDVTMWTGSDGHGCTASEIFSRQNGKPTMKHLMIRRVMTPEQAIAATLGAGTCRDKGNIERFICSECGCRLDLQDDDWEATMWLDEAAMVPNYCPNCGKKVVYE